MLGALSITSGTSDLDTYLIDLKGREQTSLRLKETKRALQGLAQSRALTKIATKLPAKTSGKKRRGKSKRL